MFVNNKQEFIGFLNCCDLIHNFVDDSMYELPTEITLSRLFTNDFARKELARLGDDNDMDMNKKLKLINDITNKYKYYGFNNNTINGITYNFTQQPMSAGIIRLEILIDIYNNIQCLFLQCL